MGRLLYLLLARVFFASYQMEIRFHACYQAEIRSYACYQLGVRRFFTGYQAKVGRFLPVIKWRWGDFWLLKGGDGKVFACYQR